MPHAIRKLAGMLVTLVIASFIIFAAMYAAPGDPVTFLIGNPENMTPERIASVRAQYHLDQPLLAQYWHWASGVLTGNFGESFKYHQPVADIMAARVPTTLSLVAYASVLLTVFGIGLGVLAAVRRRTAVDSLVVSGTTLAASIPSFVLGIALVALFSVQLRWFPVAGIGGPGFGERLFHLTLPALTLAITALAIVSRVTRQTMIEQFTSEHVEAARATGLRERFIVRDHVLRNAWGPIITMVALVIASMIAGTVAVETVFGLSGVGSLLVDAINTHDFPVVQAVLLFMVVAYMVVTTVVDLLLPVLDPRISGKVAPR
ncbi:ABC transporter permease [Leucobacter luti]|uniref:ABC transporter permease n=1 Tax=Leucobacter luti TaxID=340320 RepID=UPI00104BF670|nr:ABC transporter permease [Leucobacter luti]MCW2289489.1 peptide/nickel transport system permease protein [Leucobacter luti]QYM74751.1 ABC transporter permease [Leucobacter luti]TCK33900.1 peptide/nickel transport system permease protein [Leucobacter luti]